MCELCGSDQERIESERGRLYGEASKLKKLASYIEGMANGSIKPHTDKAKETGGLAVLIAHDLIKEWA